MARNKYFCDFCQCAFPDNPTNRKNHNEGAAHINNRKLHYDWFKEPNVFLQEQIDKPPCKFYHQRGYCEFGLLCKFSHITYDSYDGHIIYPPELIQWLELKERERLHLEQRELKAAAQTNTSNTKAKRQRYKLPAGWKVRNLPASLKPPSSKGGYDWYNVGIWG